MQRRTFIWSTSGAVLALGIGVTGCTTTTMADSENGQAGKRRSIDAGVDSTLTRLYGTANGSRELVRRARGVLTFPSVVDAGFIIGGQYGEGSLRVGGQTTGFYSTITGSIASRPACNRGPSCSCS